MTVITDDMPHLESASLGIWVKAGSRSETLEEHGISDKDFDGIHNECRTILFPNTECCKYFVEDIVGSCCARDCIDRMQRAIQIQHQ